jgi:type I restriction enzyme, S subunit
VSWQLRVAKGKRFGRIAPRVQEIDRPELQSLSVYLELGVVPRADRDDNHNRLGADLSKYLVVRPGDVVFNKLRTWQGGFGVSEHEGLVSPAYFVCRPLEEIEPRWLGYVLHSSPYLAELTRISKWMPPSQFDIAWPDLSSLKIAVPRRSKQRAIADFLDTETARIDSLLELRNRQLELFTDRLRSVISETVEDGELLPMRRHLSLLTSGPRGWADQVSDEGDLFIRSANLCRDAIELDLGDIQRVTPPSSPEATRSRVAKGDVLVGITGANCGWVAVADQRAQGGYVSQHVAILRFQGVEPRWMAYSLFSTQAQQQLFAGQYGGTKQQLSLEDLARLRVRVPSPTLQTKLVQQLDLERLPAAKFDVMLRRQVELLKERKQALITAAVTGQLDLARGC